MKIKKRKKGGGGKLSRSEIVSVRLDPKIRFGAELAAKKQRRTLSSYIEWVVEESLDKVILPPSDMGTEWSAYTAMLNCWNVDESERFINVAHSQPWSLTHDEEVLWQLIKETDYFWSGKWDEKGKWVKLSTDRHHIILERLKEQWEKLNQIVAGELTKDSLPVMKKSKRK